VMPPMSRRQPRGLHSPFERWPPRTFGSRFVVPTVAGCVDIVVHLVTEPDGYRQVREIVAVPGGVEGEVVELEPSTKHHRARLIGGDQQVVVE
jgi:hypothetical protein